MKKTRPPLSAMPNKDADRFAVNTTWSRMRDPKMGTTTYCLVKKTEDGPHLFRYAIFQPGTPRRVVAEKLSALRTYFRGLTAGRSMQ